MVKRTGNRRPDAINREFGEKPFINDPNISYLENANKVMLAAMARRRLEKHSEFQRPWLFDDYLPMDEYYPVPFIYPDWPDMQPVVSETFIPENWDTTCWCSLSLFNPLYCDSAIQVNVGPSSLMKDGVQGECIDSASFVVLVDGVEIPQSRLTNFTFFGFDIEAPDGDWTPVPPIGSGESVRVTVYSRRKKGARKPMCDVVKRMFCYEREECNCAAADPFTFDDASTPDTIAPGGSISVYVAGGCGPYSWSVVGTGFTLDSATTPNGTVVNGLNSASGTCGVNYSPFATVTVTDNCGDNVEFVIRNTGGTWALQGNRNSSARFAGDCGGGSSTGCPTGGLSYNIYVGEERWRLVETSFFQADCDCDWSPETWATGLVPPPCGSPYNCWLEAKPFLNNPVDSCCTATVHVDGFRYHYYKWEC